MCKDLVPFSNSAKPSRLLPGLDRLILKVAVGLLVDVNTARICSKNLWPMEARRTNFELFR